MRKSVSIVEARRDLGRLAEEVRRTGRPVVLTRRGRAVARIAPEPVLPTRRRDALGVLRGTLTINCSFRTLRHAIRELRGEFAQNLARRAIPPMAPYGAALSPPRGLPRLPGSMVIAQTDPLPNRPTA